LKKYKKIQLIKAACLLFWRYLIKMSSSHPPNLKIRWIIFVWTWKNNFYVESAFTCHYFFSREKNADMRIALRWINARVLMNRFTSFSYGAKMLTPPPLQPCIWACVLMHLCKGIIYMNNQYVERKGYCLVERVLREWVLSTNHSLSHLHIFLNI